MPVFRRKGRHRVNWTALHWQQLQYGADAPYQRFGVPNVSTRRRMGASDFSADSMGLAKAAWDDLHEELLAEVKDPWTIWAYRRFVLDVEPLGVDTGPFPAIPPKAK
jgi:hypothetical protein